MNGLVLGVDGGGSKTIAILVDRKGQVASIASGGGINPLDQVNWQAVARGVMDVIRGLLDAVEFACFGAPGYGEIPAITAIQDEFFKNQFPGLTIVENDVRLAFDGAFLTEPGILLLVGTGSMVWASDGVRHERIGGWSEIYGDEGSGFWIGREALSVITRHLDGRLEAAELCASLLQRLSISGVRANEQVFDWVYNSAHRRSTIASIAELVNTQATAGDPVAQNLMDRACELQAEHIIAARKIFGNEMPWAITGGVGKSLYVQQRLTTLVGTQCDRHLPPVGGAAWRAAQAAGWAPDQSWIRQLRISLAEHGVHS